jgi:hypothetical protein
MWVTSNMEVWLKEVLEEVDHLLFIYGDQAYSGACGVIGTYVRGARQNLSKKEKFFNKKMVGIRNTIE